MPFLGAYMTEQDNDWTTDPQDRPGAEGGSHPPPEGASPIMTKRWVDVSWAFDEPEPGGACTGFDVAVFSGASLEGGALAMPVVTLDAPEATRWLTLLELRSNVMLRAAVRARYGEFRSVWAEAAVAAEFIPDSQSPQEDASGSLRMADGTIMQWFTTGPMSAATAYTFAWPAPFPQRCYTAVATPLGALAQPGFTPTDAYLQLAGVTAAGVTINRLSPTGSNNAPYPLRARVVGWGV